MKEFWLELLKYEGVKFAIGIGFCVVFILVYLMYSWVTERGNKKGEKNE
jgi:hypothetical protein